MKNRVIELPDPDWVIIKAAKTFEKGHHYMINHKHKDHIRAKATYCAILSGMKMQHKCSWCNEIVPEEVNGFRNLIEWSEV